MAGFGSGAPPLADFAERSKVATARARLGCWAGRMGKFGGRDEAEAEAEAAVAVGREGGRGSSGDKVNLTNVSSAGAGTLSPVVRRLPRRTLDRCEAFKPARGSAGVACLLLPAAMRAAKRSLRGLCCAAASRCLGGVLDGPAFAAGRPARGRGRALDNAGSSDRAPSAPSALASETRFSQPILGSRAQPPSPPRRAAAARALAGCASLWGAPAV